MKRVFKVISLILVITIFFSSCTMGSEKTISKINDYIQSNNFNECLEFVKGLEQDEKEKINDEVCVIVINKFIEIKDKSKISFDKLYDLSTFTTSFIENCQKLWNIISEFSIDKEDNFYTNSIYLHYFAEMIDFARYDEIYSLVNRVYQTNYLDKLSTALYEYEINGNNNSLSLIYDEIKSINLASYDPHQFLITDFRDSHEKIITSLYKLKNAFSTSDSNSVAISINSLKNELTNILYITDTIIAVNSMQKNILNKLSTENLFNHINSEIEVEKREFIAGMSFSLNVVFGEHINSPIEDNEESTTLSQDEKISKDEVLDIVVNAINKTKNYKNNVSITYIQTRDIVLTDFKSNTNIKDAEEILKSQLIHTLEQSNGTGKKVYQFKNGSDGTQTLSDFVPPSSKNANANIDGVIDFSFIKGSGGYVVKLKLDREFVKSGQPSTIINSLVNTFEFENSSEVKKYESSYAETDIELIINNNGRLAELSYTLDGVSNCDFEENNGENQYKAQFTFKNKYTYKFSY